MTVRDGFKLGLGIALGFVVVGLVLGVVAGVFDAARAPSPASAVDYAPRTKKPTVSSNPADWGCGRQCRVVDEREVCVDNPPCPPKP